MCFHLFDVIAEINLTILVDEYLYEVMPRALVSGLATSLSAMQVEENERTCII